MRWNVEVQSLQGDARLIRELLASFGLELVELDGRRYLAGPLLEPCATPAEVRQKASEVSRAVATAAEHDPALQLGVTLGDGVTETTAEGEVRQHVFVALTGVAAIFEAGDLCSATAVAETVSEDELRRRAAEQAERDFQARLRHALARVQSAHRSEDAVKVQRLLAKDLSPHTMGLISDVIKPARPSLGGSDNQWTRFNRSINHADVFGDLARHGKSNMDPPPDPMTLEEAQSFIRVVAEKWLEQVAAGLL